MCAQEEYEAAKAQGKDNYDRELLVRAHTLTWTVCLDPPTALKPPSQYEA